MTSQTEGTRTKSGTQKNSIVQYGVAAVAIALVVGLCVSIIMYSNITRKYAATRNQLGASIYQNLDLMVRKNEEVSLAGADIQGTVLPQMREYYIAAKSLNDTMAEAYGDKYTVLNTDLVNSLDSAFSAYNMAFKSGKSTAEAQSMMDTCIQEVQSVLQTRFDSAELNLIAT